MIETVKILQEHLELSQLLEKNIKPYMTPDVSSYARGRLRAWLKYEPSLFAPIVLKPAVPVPDQVWIGLQKLIGWDFNYCLATFSGKDEPTGILPHRDAAYADYEAYGLNVTETCEFKYWMGRESFGSVPDTHGYNPEKDLPTHVLNLVPGQLIRFNCKNIHQAIPSSNRWNLNFWKSNPKRDVQYPSPKVYNKRDTNIPPDAIYVGRPTEWGNPFSHMNDTLAEHKTDTRDEAVESYREYILGNKNLLGKLHSLRGRDLVCWCAPRPCHADILIELANKHE